MVYFVLCKTKINQNVDDVRVIHLPPQTQNPLGLNLLAQVTKKGSYATLHKKSFIHEIRGII